MGAGIGGDGEGAGIVTDDLRPADGERAGSGGPDGDLLAREVALDVEIEAEGPLFGGNDPGRHGDGGVPPDGAGLQLGGAVAVPQPAGGEAVDLPVRVESNVVDGERPPAWLQAQSVEMPGSAPSLNGCRVAPMYSWPASSTSPPRAGYNATYSVAVERRIGSYGSGMRTTTETPNRPPATPMVVPPSPSRQTACSHDSPSCVRSMNTEATDDIVPGGGGYGREPKRRARARRR